VTRTIYLSHASGLGRHVYTVPPELGMQPHPLAIFSFPNLIRFGQIWLDLVEIWAKMIRFGQILFRFGQNQNLASPNTFALLIWLSIYIRCWP